MLRIKDKPWYRSIIQLIHCKDMKDPVEAFTWLLDQFRLYTRNEITWREVRTIFTEAEDLRDQFHALETTDDIAMFGMAIRNRDRQSNTLSDCTDDFLRGRMGLYDDPVVAGYISLLLWRRQQNAGQ